MNVELDKTSLYLAKYNSLKYSFKKDNSKFPQSIINILEKLSDPFDYFCFCLESDKDFDQARPNSFVSHFILEFEKYVNEKNDCKTLLTSSAQIKAFEIFKKLKVVALKNAIGKAFSLSSVPHLIVPLLKMELKQKNNVSVANSVEKLKYQSHFDLYELVVPLFLQNKINEIEKLLEPSPELQKEFLSLLDGIVGNEIQISDLIYSCNVKEIKGQQSPKVIYKLGLRLLKKYNINTESCPHIIHRSKLSSLRYLFLRCYQQNELAIDSLILFAIELSKNSIPLQIEALDLFLEYYDAFGAILFLQKENIPKRYIPHQISRLLNDPQVMDNERLGHQSTHQEKLNYEDFYTLSIPNDSVYQIDTIQDFNIALHNLQSVSLIGIDTEWKPTLQFDKEEELMLLQIATVDRVYLFDMLNLQNVLSVEHWEKLGKIFSNTRITKLTYSFSGDIKCLGGFNVKLKEHLKKMSNVIDLNETKKFLVDYYPQFFPFINNKPNNFSYKGLSEMVYFCFGKPLNKMEQCSYWSVRPLSQSQVVYAALDAFCLIDIYNYLNEMARHLNIPDWQTLRPDSAKETNKVQSVKAKNQKSNNSTKPKTGNVEIKKETNKKQVPASELKVVCDSMLQGLGKLLRSCNIDTEILASSDYHDKCIEFFEKEERIVLTRGNVYHQIVKHVPQTHVLCIKNDIVKMQLDEVIRQFEVIIEEDDIFARCCECNSNGFMLFDPKLLSKAKSMKGRSSSAGPKWVFVDDGKIKFNMTEAVTEKGLKIRVEEVPYGVLNKVAVVYVCGGCGKCYWDGSHMDRMRGNLSHVIRHSVP